MAQDKDAVDYVAFVQRAKEVQLEQRLAECDRLYDLMRDSVIGVKTRDRRKGLTVFRKVFKAEHVVQWLLDNVDECQDVHDAVALAQEFMTYSYWRRQDSNESRFVPQRSIYAFVADEDPLAMNLKRNHPYPSRSPYDIAHDLCVRMTNLNRRFVHLKPMQRFQHIQASDEYTALVNTSLELHGVPLRALIDLDKAQRVSMWLNIYNTLSLHGMLRTHHFDLNLRRNLLEKVVYIIGGRRFCCADIVAILLGHRSHFKDKSMAELCLSESDVDPRVHFGLCVVNQEQWDTVYTEDNIDEALEIHTMAALHSTTVNFASKVIQVPHVLKSVWTDFGQTHSDLLRWLLKYVEPEQVHMVELIGVDRMKVTFKSQYDTISWSQATTGEDRSRNVSEFTSELTSEWTSTLSTATTTFVDTDTFTATVTDVDDTPVAVDITSPSTAASPFSPAPAINSPWTVSRAHKPPTPSPLKVTDSLASKILVEHSKYQQKYEDLIRQNELLRAKIGDLDEEARQVNRTLHQQGQEMGQLKTRVANWKSKVDDVVRKRHQREQQADKWKQRAKKNMHIAELSKASITLICKETADHLKRIHEQFKSVEDGGGELVHPIASGGRSSPSRRTSTNATSAPSRASKSSLSRRGGSHVSGKPTASGAMIHDVLIHRINDRLPLPDCSWADVSDLEGSVPAPVSSSAHTCNSLITELLASERLYVNTLQHIMALLVDPLMKALQQPKPILSQTHVTDCFGNWIELTAVSRSLCDSLEQHASSDLASEQRNVGLPFVRHAVVLQCYGSYYSGYRVQLERLHELLTTSKEFMTLWASACADPLLQGVDVYTCLAQPLQRFPKYPRLLQSILKHMPLSHPFYDDCVRAFELMVKTCQEVRANLMMCTDVKRLVRLQREWSWARQQATLIKPHRVLLYEEPKAWPFIKVREAADTVAMRKGLVYVFNDMLVIGTMHKKRLYLVCMAPLEECTVEAVPCEALPPLRKGSFANAASVRVASVSDLYYAVEAPSPLERKHFVSLCTRLIHYNQAIRSGAKTQD